MYLKKLARSFLGLCFLTSAAFAQRTTTLNFGQTSVTLSPTFTGALKTLGVTPGAVAPSAIFGDQTFFPIIGGAVDLDSAAGNIIHSGGLTLTAGGIEIRLESFIIDTTSTTTGAPVLTGLVLKNNQLLGRFPLFNLALPPNFSLPLTSNGFFLLLDNVGLTLNPTAAGLLNSVYGLKGASAIPTTAPLLPIGTANVTGISIFQ